MEMYGQDWLEEVYHFIQEDRRNDLQSLAALMPLARTPQSKEGGKAMEDYHRNMLKWLESMTPWLRKKRSDLRSLRNRVKSGQVVVIPDGPGDPLFKDATPQKDS